MRQNEFVGGEELHQHNFFKAQAQHGTQSYTMTPWSEFSTAQAIVPETPTKPTFDISKLQEEGQIWRRVEHSVRALPQTYLLQIEFQYTKESTGVKLFVGIHTHSGFYNHTVTCAQKSKIKIMERVHKHAPWTEDHMRQH